MNISEPFIHRPIATVAADGRAAVVRTGHLPPAAGRGAAQRRLPDHSDQRAIARRRSANHGVVGRDAAGTAVEPDTGTDAAHLIQRARLCTVDRAVRIEPNVDSAAVDVLAAINAASPFLPANMPYPPTIRKVNPADTPIVLLALTSDTLPLTTVDAYAENILLPKISQISGVGQVGIGGQQKPAIRVQVNPQALASRGLSLEDVRNVLAGANVDLPKGTLNSPRQTFTLNTNDQLLKPDAYDDLIIAYRNGAPVRIRDIGQGDRGARERPAGGLVQQAARHHPPDPARARRQRHPDRRQHQDICCRSSKPLFLPPSRSRSRPTAPRRSGHRSPMCALP